ncbi:MAG: S1/P1 nuclease [Flavobacterium sp.]|nr:S1/P1 nuclease [Flavobacterium sp.]
MNKALFTLTFLLTLLIYPIKTFAWGSKGHALVAEVAFNYMDENTKKEVLKYLDGMTIQEAANWMDNIKSDHSYDFMRAYHFANFEKGTNVVETSGANIIYQLNAAIKELKNKEKFSKEEINTKIKILFHLMGDLHQPLHVGYGEDKGGNTMQINYNFRGTNLHSLWDSGIIEYKKISLSDCLNTNKYSPNEIRALQNIDVVYWATGSRSYLPQIYKTGGNKINEEYVDACVPIIENQILKAGIRLAGVLNEVFQIKKLI